MFKVKDFKTVLDALIETAKSLEEMGEDTMSSDYKSDIKCYVFPHSDSVSIIVALRSDDKTQINFRYDKKKNTYESRFEQPAKYKPELELIYMGELEKVLKEGNKKLGTARKAYNTQIERIYHKVLKDNELLEKRKTTCYIK